MRANKKTEGLNKGYLFDGKKREYDAPLSSYPRTSFVRNSYFSLNGDWDFKYYSSIIDLEDDFISAPSFTTTSFETTQLCKEPKILAP